MKYLVTYKMRGRKDVFSSVVEASTPLAAVKKVTKGNGADCFYCRIDWGKTYDLNGIKSKKCVMCDQPMRASEEENDHEGCRGFYP